MSAAIGPAYLTRVDYSGSTVGRTDVFGFAKVRPLYFRHSRAEPGVGHHALGNDYRLYSATLKRFFQPDRFSPFMQGGVNSYAYCLGDPVNQYDPTGRASIYSSARKAISRMLGRTSSRVTQPRFHHKGIINLLPATTWKPMSAVPEEGLYNRHAWDLIPEAEAYEKDKLHAHLLSSGSSRFLAQLKPGRDYKYVANNHGEIIASPWINREGGIVPSHAALALRFRKKGTIVASGHLTVQRYGEIVISNLSGHYRPSRRTLNWPALWLSSQGAAVRIEYAPVGPGSS